MAYRKLKAISPLEGGQGFEYGGEEVKPDLAFVFDGASRPWLGFRCIERVRTSGGIIVTTEEDVIDSDAVLPAGSLVLLGEGGSALGMTLKDQKQRNLRRVFLDEAGNIDKTKPVIDATDDPAKQRDTMQERIPGEPSRAHRVDAAFLRIVIHDAPGWLVTQNYRETAKLVPPSVSRTLQLVG